MVGVVRGDRYVEFYSAKLCTNPKFILIPTTPSCLLARYCPLLQYWAWTPSYGRVEVTTYSVVHAKLYIRLLELCVLAGHCDEHCVAVIE